MPMRHVRSAQRFSKKFRFLHSQRGCERIGKSFTSHRLCERTPRTLLGLSLQVFSWHNSTSYPFVHDFDSNMLCPAFQGAVTRAKADRTATTRAIVSHVTITLGAGEVVYATNVVPTPVAGTLSRGNAEDVSTR